MSGAQSDTNPSATFSPKNIEDLDKDQTAGSPFPKSLIVNVNREHQMIVAAIHMPQATVGSGLEARHFECSDYRTLWRAISILYANCKAAKGAGQVGVPEVIIAEDLLHESMLLDSDRFGSPFGRRFITRLCREEPVSHYRAVELIPLELKSKCQLKEFADTCRNWAADIPESSTPTQLQQTLAMHAREFSRVAAVDVHVEDPVDWSNWRSSVKKGNVVRTFFNEIDEPTGGGLGRGELMVVGGGTGHGKSFFSTAMMKKQFESEDFHKTLYISLEDSAEVLKYRLMAQYLPSGITPAQIRQKMSGYNTISDDLMDEAVERAKRYRGRVESIHAPKWSLGRICSAIHQRKYQSGTDLVIIDYLQAVQPNNPDSKNSQNFETSMAVSTLKQLAHEHGFALVVTSQYARDEYRAGQEPSVNACKYAGDIENEAEVMAMMWRDENAELFIKLAKLKWAHVQGLRYKVQTDRSTGEILDWMRYVEPPPDPNAPTKGKGRSNFAGGRGR